MKPVHGWVCITNANIDRKHDERVFFSEGIQEKGPYPVTDDHRRMWRELIQNCQSIHEEDLRRRRSRNQQPDEYLGPKPGQTAWSRHIYTEADRNLTDGTLCYVRLSTDQLNVKAFFPVMIARELFETSPWDLLDDSLRPAAAIDRLSAADRVFGWVKVDTDTGARTRGEHVAARGLLRIGPVRCTSDSAEAVERFAPPGVPLAILSAPKPQQGRFYVAQSPNGEAQKDGLSKQAAGYALGKGLRGRKVYPHQASLPNGHWSNPTEDRTQQAQGNPAHYQEYRRPRNNGEERDDQNRSILAWVKPGAEFSFDFHVQNLSAVELGALLWLLDLPFIRAFLTSCRGHGDDLPIHSTLGPRRTVSRAAQALMVSHSSGSLPTNTPVRDTRCQSSQPTTDYQPFKIALEAVRADTRVVVKVPVTPVLQVNRANEPSEDTPPSAGSHTSTTVWSAPESDTGHARLRRAHGRNPDRVLLEGSHCSARHHDVSRLASCHAYHIDTGRRRGSEAERGNAALREELQGYRE
ncbi:MAG: hypothetical protein HY650_02335 [Acidobacteria bacterium]|nr:hypothetical protein [Acidobacteriota bacterium]